MLLQRRIFRVYQHERQGGGRAEVHARFLGPKALGMTPSWGRRTRARAPAPQRALGMALFWGRRSRAGAAAPRPALGVTLSWGEGVRGRGRPRHNGTYWKW